MRKIVDVCLVVFGLALAASGDGTLEPTGRVRRAQTQTSPNAYAVSPPARSTDQTDHPLRPVQMKLRPRGK